MPPLLARPEVLALGIDRDTLAALLRAAHRAGAAGFSAHSVEAARQYFLGRGGLDVLVIAPDTTPHVAETVSRTIWAVDPSVDIVVFGRELLRTATHANVHRIADLHPRSRAGLGALFRHVAACRAPEHA